MTVVGMAIAGVAVGGAAAIGMAVSASEASKASVAAAALAAEATKAAANSELQGVKHTNETMLVDNQTWIDADVAATNQERKWELEDRKYAEKHKNEELGGEVNVYFEDSRSGYDLPEPSSNI